MTTLGQYHYLKQWTNQFPRLSVEQNQDIRFHALIGFLFINAPLLQTIPKRKIAEFDATIFKDILRNYRDGLILIYPMNHNKWDSRMSAVTANEDIFCFVAFLRSSIQLSRESLDYLMERNPNILNICQQARISAKQYILHHMTEEDWKTHFGEKWD